VLSRIQEFRYRHEFANRWLRNGALLVGAGFLFGLGIFAATGLDDRTTEVIRYSPAGAGALLSTDTAGNKTAEVITETVRRKGKVVRLIRHRRGNPVVRTLPGPGTTIRGALTVANSHTVTTRVVNTVTVVQQVTVPAPPETVTVVETVTCKPSDC
jgi:hypothetical protein